VRYFGCTGPAQALADRKRGASVGEADFDYNVSVVRNKYVTQIVAIFCGQCNAFEISFKRPAASGTISMQLGADSSDPMIVWSHQFVRMIDRNDSKLRNISTLISSNAGMIPDHSPAAGKSGYCAVIRYMNASA
jgi:hypothetical protein